jgi:hypothetical protein
VLVRALGGCVDKWMYVIGWGVVDAGPMEVVVQGGGGVCACGRREGHGGVIYLFNGSVKYFEYG